MKILFVYGAFENLGIEYLSAVLKEHGHHTCLAFDPRLFNDSFLKVKSLAKFFNFEKYLLRQVADYTPGLVVFSVVSADSVWASRVSSLIRESFPSIPIVFGGIHPTSVPEIVLRKTCADFVIVGEGEHALLELVDALERKRTRYDIENVYFKYGDKIINNRVRPYISDLDSLPFPDKELYYSVIPQYRNGYLLITRRGCVNSCSYCHNSVWQSIYSNQNKLRIRSVANVIRELKIAKKKYNFKKLRINDDLFTFNKEWLKEFSEHYRLEIDIPIYCFGSPGTVDAEVIVYLKNMKCYQLCLGAQSLNPLIRENILNRREDNERIAESIRLCKKYRIRCVVDNIIGLPSEREEDLVEMAKFYNINRPDRVCIFWLIYLPKTPIVDIGLKERVLDPSIITEIENNPCTTANILHNKFHQKEKRRYYWLLLLLPFFPPQLYKWFIKKSLFKFLPTVNPILLETMLTVFAKDRLDIPRGRYYVRYFKYIKMILAEKTALFFGNC